MAILAALWFAATSDEPWVAAKPAPNAEEAGAARSILKQLRGGALDPGRAMRVALTAPQLAGFSALASHGLRPDRVRVSVQSGTLVIEAARPVPGGRWLNFRATFAGKSTGFPSPQLSVGKFSLPAIFGRYPFELARSVLVLSGSDLPPLDGIVRTVIVEQEALTAWVKFPHKTGVVDRLAGLGGRTIDAQMVVRAYCHLTARQRARPRADFEGQVRRAFSFDTSAASPERNGAALVALAMFAADAKAGYLAGIEKRQIARCRMAPPVLTLHGRADLPKHWALSAAISAAQGSQLARAVGEWKELADSLPKAKPGARPPSGFSFVDLAADRAGFGTAAAAMSPLTATATAKRLATATAGALLPIVLLEEPEGMTSADFARRYGNLDANRYNAAVVAIDKVLAQSGSSKP